MGIIALLNVLAVRRLMVGWAVLVGGLVGLAACFILPMQYSATSRVQVDSIQRNSLTGLVEPRVRVGEFLGQQAAVATSRTVALQVIDRLVADGAIALEDYETRWRQETGGEALAGNDSRLWAADQLLRNLKVSADPIESTLAINYVASDPAEAARIANAFASAYMETVVGQRQQRFARNAQSFSTETQTLSADLERAQNELAAFRDKAGLVAFGGGGVDSGEVELAAVMGRLAQARADEAEARSLLQQATATAAGDLVNFPLPDDALAARQTQARLAEVRALHSRIGARYGERSREMTTVSREKADLERDLMQAIRDRASYSATRVRALEASAEQMKAEVAAKQRTRETYNLLQEKVATSRETFNLVASRTLEESLQSRVDAIDAILLARAVPPANATTPPPAVIVFLGLIAGALVGASTAVAVELIEGRTRTIQDIRRIFRTPILVEVVAPQRRLQRHLLRNASLVGARAAPQRLPNVHNNSHRYSASGSLAS